MFISQLKPLNQAIQQLFIIGVMGLGQVATIQVVQANTVSTQYYQISAGSLDAALIQFASQAGVELSFEPESIKSLKTNGLKGNYSVSDGFNSLLAPHQLQAKQTATGYKLIAQTQTQARDMGQLKPIDVTASSSANRDSNVTQLPVITVNAEKNGSAEDGYLVKNITGVGIWGERSLQDTPYSMTVIPQELIENIQANDMAQIFKMNPLTQSGAQYYSGNYYTIIRGFSSNNAVINGMPLANWYSFTTMEDLERVETINGATGFLYGGGRVGGAVNYVMKKPTLEDKRTIKIGNYGGNQYYGHLDLSGQIDRNNIFGYRINALYQDGNSIDDISKEQKYISISLDYKPADNLYIDFNYAHRELLRTRIKPDIYISSNTFRPTLDVSKNYSPDWLSSDEKNDRIFTNSRWNINDSLTFRSSLLYEKADIKQLGSQYIYTRADGLYDVYNYRMTSLPQKFESYAGSLYLDKKFKTYNIDHLLTVGYSENYYKKSSPKNIQLESISTRIALNDIKNLLLPSENIPNSDIIPIAKTQYKNILVGDDITFNDQWTALIGLNYATVISTIYSNGIQSTKYDRSALTPTLSLIYKPTQNLTTYATYIESLEIGAIVGNNYSNKGDILSPLISKQYEIGTKYNVLDDKLLFTSALFRIEKANQYSDLATPTPKYVQDGEQIHQGLELTFTGKVTDHLTLIGGGTWMDLSVEKSNNPTLEGKKPVNAASKMAKIYAEYAVPQLEGLTLSGGAYYTGEKYGNTSNTDKIPAYTLFDVGARYTTQIAQFPTTFNLTMSNVTGKNYWASNTYLGDPRTVAFSVKTLF